VGWKDKSRKGEVSSFKERFTGCVNNLDLQNEMINVEVLLTTFEASLIFEALGAILSRA